MAHKTLPSSIRKFVAAQPTEPIKKLYKGWSANSRTGPVPWSDFVYRLVAGFLLSGDIRPKQDGYPNRTDMERVGKRSNFHPGLCDHLGRLLIAGKVIAVKSNRYVAGPNASALDAWDLPTMRKAFFTALIEFIDDFTPHRLWRPTMAISAGFPAFLAALAHAFRGLALDWEQAGKVVAEFSGLPPATLATLAPDADHLPSDTWFDEPGQSAFLEALLSCGAANLMHDDERKLWFLFSNDLDVFFELVKAEKPEPFARELTVQADLSLVMGSDLPMATLGLLLRGGSLTGKGKVLTMKLERERLDQMRPDKQALKRFSSLLRDSGPLPSTVVALLKGSAPVTGSLTLRMCNALVKSDNGALLEAVQKHPRLKGYLEPGAPPGYLLIKSTSNLPNFMERCSECGFEISLSR